MFIYTPKSTMYSPCLKHFYSRYLVILFSHLLIPSSPPSNFRPVGHVQGFIFVSVFFFLTHITVSLSRHMVCIPCSVNTSQVKTLNNRQFMSQSAFQMLILFLSFAERWEREGRKILEGRGTWRGDMEGKDMPAGQSCDVLRHVRICVRTCTS